MFMKTYQLKFVAFDEFATPQEAIAAIREPFVDVLADRPRIVDVRFSREWFRLHLETGDAIEFGLVDGRMDMRVIEDDASGLDAPQEPIPKEIHAFRTGGEVVWDPHEMPHRLRGKPLYRVLDSGGVGYIYAERAPITWLGVMECRVMGARRLHWDEEID